jgi:hypothetical protein
VSADAGRLLAILHTVSQAMNAYALATEHEGIGSRNAYDDLHLLEWLDDKEQEGALRAPVLEVFGAIVERDLSVGEWAGLDDHEAQALYEAQQETYYDATEKVGMLWPACDDCWDRHDPEGKCS